MSKDVWDALWMAGYIDYDLYTEVEKQMIIAGYTPYFETILTIATLPTAEISLLSRFIVSSTVGRLFVREAQVIALRAFVSKELPSASSRLLGPVLESERVVATFAGKKYVNRKLATEEQFYKYHGVSNRTGNKVSWLTKKRYSTEEELRRDLAIKKDWGIEVTGVTTFRAPAGTWVSEGAAAGQGTGYPGGGYQAVIKNVPRTWIIRTERPW